MIQFLKRNLFSILLFATVASCTTLKNTTTENSSRDNRIEQLIQQLHHPESENVLVASHRCDWRNHPENSIPALISSINMGVDIAEIDLKKTKDDVLIIMHDKTIDRTTNGKGKPEDYTLGEIKKFRLKNGLGRVTENSIPTFKEFIEVAKGKIWIDVDKGYDYLPDVIKLLKETKTLNQAMINIDDNTTLDEVEERFGKIDDEVMLMPIVVYNDKAKAQQVVKSFLRRKNTIFQPVWKDDKSIEDEDFLLLKKQGYGIWLNSLWASLNGGHNDDRAVEQNQPDETWGWLIKKGASIIQTDRPKDLLMYLQKKGLHQ